DFMLALLGIAAVFLAVIGGFLLEHGNPWVLLQPAELLIVGGATMGIVLVANPPAVIHRMWLGAVSAFRPPRRSPAVFLKHLRMLYEVFSYVQRAGIVALEGDVEEPEKSAIFTNHPEFLRDRPTRSFICD